MGLEVLSLAYLGASVVHADRTEEGMLLLDESLAALAGHEVDDFSVLEEAFCQLFSACEHAHDVGRAEEWMRVGTALAERRRLPVVSAFCRTHYGGLLTTAGRWPEAEATLTEAIRLWGLGQRSGMRASALVRLADLRARQGRYEEAEQLLAGRDGDLEAARPLAAAQLARGDAALAAEVLARALAQLDATSTAAAPLLALRVDVELAAGDVAGAAATVDRLAAIAEAHPGHHYLRARGVPGPGPGVPGRRRRATRGGACARRWPASTGRRCRSRSPGRASSWPTCWSTTAPRWRWPRPGPRWRPSSGCRRPATPTRPPPPFAASASAPARPPGGAPRRPGAGRSPRPGGPGAPGPRRTSLTAREAEVLDLLGHGLPTPRSPPGSTSAARRSSTTWATCWPSSACAAGRRPRPTPPAPGSATQ